MKFYSLFKIFFPLKASTSIPNVTEMKTNMSLGLTLTRNMGTGGFLVSVYLSNSHPFQESMKLGSSCHPIYQIKSRYLNVRVCFWINRAMWISNMKCPSFDVQTSSDIQQNQCHKTSQKKTAQGIPILCPWRVCLAFVDNSRIPGFISPSHRNIQDRFC